MTWLSTIFQTMSQPFRWWVVVAPWEEGIRVRLGKTAVALAPGIHLRIPFLDRVYVQSIRLRIITSGSRTVSTLDKKVVTFTLAVRFAIRDVKQLYNTISDPENTLLNHVSASAAEYISQTNSDCLSHKGLEDHVSRDIINEDWGLSDVSAHVIDFAIARTYRLIGNVYERTAGLDLDRGDNGLR